MENHISQVVAEIGDAVLEAFLEVRVDSLHHRSLNFQERLQHCITDLQKRRPPHD